MRKFLGNILQKSNDAAGRFRRDERGVAAIEFCFIAPLLITIWLGTMEISQGIEVNKKVGRSASMIGDIITQEESQTVAQIEDILKVGAAVLQPYNRDAPRITVTEIFINAGLAASVVWSRRSEDGVFSRPYAPNAAVTTLPPNLKIANTYLVRVETQLEYIPITSWTIKKNKTKAGQGYASVNMAETYYLRPRPGADVECIGC